MGFLLESFFYKYIVIIFICYITRVVIFVINIDLSYLSEKYFNIIDCIHDFLEADCPQTNFDIDPNNFNNIINNRKYFKLTHSKKDQEDTFLNNLLTKEKVTNENFIFNVGTNLLVSGFEAIIEDDVIPTMEHHPDYTRYQFAFNPYNLKGKLQKIIAWSIIIYRFVFLAPIRLLFILTAIISFICAWICGQVNKLTIYERKLMGQFGSKLILASFGICINFHNEENKPVSPGFIIANHMSPTDAFPLFLNIDLLDETVIYVTGQIGKGAIRIFQTIVSSILPTFWVNRHNPSERKRFLDKILKTAKTENLILLFPEGYCSNSRKTLQFRKAIFVDNVNIYPIAYKQNSKYNDIFWWEDHFPEFFIRQITSLGSIYDIYYLPKLVKRSYEKEEDFAYRTSKVIATKLGTNPSSWNGELIYKKNCKEKVKEGIQKQLCLHLNIHLI